MLIYECSTAGPLPETVVDFWHLVWQEKTLTIVVLTNLVEGTKKKCQQYWPDSGTKSDMYGPFQVTIIDEEILADYTTRSLLVQVCVCLCLIVIPVGLIVCCVPLQFPHTS